MEIDTNSDVPRFLYRVMHNGSQARLDPAGNLVAMTQQEDASFQAGDTEMIRVIQLHAKEDRSAPTPFISLWGDEIKALLEAQRLSGRVSGLYVLRIDTRKMMADIIVLGFKFMERIFGVYPRNWNQETDREYLIVNAIPAKAIKAMYFPDHDGREVSCAKCDRYDIVHTLEEISGCDVRGEVALEMISAYTADTSFKNWRPAYILDAFGIMKIIMQQVDRSVIENADYRIHVVEGQGSPSSKAFSIDHKRQTVTVPPALLQKWMGELDEFRDKVRLAARLSLIKLEKERYVATYQLMHDITRPLFEDLDAWLKKAELALATVAFTRSKASADTATRNDGRASTANAASDNTQVIVGINPSSSNQQITEPISEQVNDHDTTVMFDGDLTVEAAVGTGSVTQMVFRPAARTPEEKDPEPPSYLDGYADPPPYSL